MARVPLLGSDTPHTGWLGEVGVLRASHLTSSSAGTHTSAPRSAPPKPRQTTTRGSGGRRGYAAGAVQVRAGAVGLRGAPTLTLAAAGPLSRSDPAPGRRAGMWRPWWLGLGSARASLRALGATGRPGSRRQGEKRPRARGRQARPGRSRCGVRKPPTRASGECAARLERAPPGWRGGLSWGRPDRPRCAPHCGL